MYSSSLPPGHSVPGINDMYGQIHSRGAASCQAIKQTQWKMMLLAPHAAFSTSLRQPGSAGPCFSRAFLQRFAVPTKDPNRAP
jgi:hypothetical protein